MPDSQAQTLPTVAPIDTAASDAALNSTVGGILATIPSAPPITATPYSVGHDTNPYIKPPVVRQPASTDNRPMGQTDHDKHVALLKNNVASVRNAISGFMNRKDQEKNDALKAEVTTVMKAQQNVDNATSILNSPTADEQSKKMAQAVLDQNKKVIEGKLSDPKLGKQIQKAFDISLTDPSENNTPEIKAGQAAQKEVAQATAAGLAPNTPEEKKVAEIAANGGASPASQTAQKTAASASVTPKSDTPYADKFLKSQPATISANPEYAAQVKAQQDRDKQITQYVIPKLIDTYAKKDLAILKEQGANNREEYKGLLTMQTEQNKLLAQKDIQDSKNKVELQKQAMSNSASMARTQLRVNAAMGASDAPGIKNTVLSKKIQEQAIKDWDTAISNVDKDNTEIAARLTVLQDPKTKNADPEEINYLNHSLSMNKLYRDQAADERQKLMTRIYGAPTGGPVDGNTAPYMKGGTSGDSSYKSSDGKQNIRSIGTTGSDSEDEDSVIDKLVSQ